MVDTAPQAGYHMCERAYDIMPRLVHTLKALADPTRLRIVQLLEGTDELCVCEIVDALQIPQYRVSRHLGLLKAAGVVTDWRQGKWMHYVINSDLSPADRSVLTSICARARKDPTGRQDQRRLKQHLRPRVNGDVVTCPE